MATNPTYRFMLRLNNAQTQTQVFPDYKDDLSIEHKRDSNQMFYRAELSSSLVFLNEDYDYIIEQPFDTEFFIDIQMSTDLGLNWSNYFTGRFCLTDCEVNVADKKVSVKPAVYDRYNGILAGMEKEYNIIPLAPALTPIYFKRRPMLQMYVPGEDIVTCILGGQSWTQEVIESTTDEGKLKDDYHFGSEINSIELNFIDTTISGLIQPFSGALSSIDKDTTGEWEAFTNSENIYKVYYFQTKTTGDMWDLCANGFSVKAISGGAEVFRYEQSVNVRTGELPRWLALPNDMVFNGVGTYEGMTLNAEMIMTCIYGRWVTAGNYISATPTNITCLEIPKNDLVANNRNYRYCYPFDVTTAMLTQTTAESTTPTEWGLKPNGKYYVKPSLASGVSDYFPIARNNWNNVSTWLKRTDTIDGWEVAGRWLSYIRDAYLIEDVIKVLLAQVAPNITFEGTTDYSQFLFGVNPILGNPGAWGRLIITPKSNMKAMEYTQPARKAELTLKNVLDMLRDVCGLYWFIDDTNKLRIEHIKWFKQGGTYTGSPSVGIDMTTLHDVRTEKVLTYGQESYNFEKSDMPERYQYEWMDDSTTIFKGQPIDVLSKFVQQGEVEEVSVSMFNADIDYIMLNPSNISDEGFALMCGQPYYSAYQTGFIELNGIPTQNFQMAFAFTQQYFLTYDMPAWELKVNGEEVIAKGIKRNKKQTVSVPVGNTDPNMMQMVKTTIGSGMIDKANINLSSRTAKMTLAFDTTAQPDPSEDPLSFRESWAEFRSMVNNKIVGTVDMEGDTHDYLLALYNFAEENYSDVLDATLYEMAVPQTGTLISDTERGKKAMISWYMAMALAEICPKIQNDLYDLGYSYIGSADSQKVYGYELDSDANIARVVASIMFAMFRPDAATLEAAARTELATADTGNALGTTRGSTIPTHSEETIAAVPDGTRFMPSTPTNTNSNPDFAFDETTWNYIYSNYYYSNGEYHNPTGKNGRAQMAVQDSARTDVAAQKQMYAAVGVTMTTAQEALITPCYKWGSRIATPMKDGFDSVSQTYLSGVGTTPRTDSEFRMRPFQYHNVHLLDPNDDGASYINTSSYPSGHASFGWNIALMMIETHRSNITEVKLIIARAFQFGQSRTIGRYHWNADVLHGLVIGSCCLPRLHSYNEYINLLALT